jgi:hypothetical protein
LIQSSIARQCRLFLNISNNCAVGLRFYSGYTQLKCGNFITCASQFNLIYAGIVKDSTRSVIYEWRSPFGYTWNNLDPLTVLHIYASLPTCAFIKNYRPLKPKAWGPDRGLIQHTAITACLASRNSKKKFSC